MCTLGEIAKDVLTRHRWHQQADDRFDQ